ncbi:beta-ketoacyl synthase N-terminal-like domain-containing protein [Tahibacter amnicola]|uniref:Beta-ketoacyl synthase-like N-terminal domain-containing protein n=1 Tax=Tahibacter amnicola TaxID=2976241 RepID=A0ABY6BIC3_9GAMM|nr:beta-ketoacyl synthase N-terminal-like domain-containing protein [Tahibacter amnicola]UXI69103.1 hypothetical protein N4264_05485 [Tahibacter amnicola]
MHARVALRRPSIRSAFGNDWQQVIASLASPPPLQAPPWPDAHTLGIEGVRAAGEPDLKSLGLDRKLSRTMEKQSRLMLAAAADTAGIAEVEQRAQTGLYLGLPMVDEPIPTWSALQNWHEDGRRTPFGVHLQRETPPFSGLSMLNSSAAAHIASTLRISGSLAVYSAFADAGLNALIDGACAVAEGDCDEALVGAVSPKLDPLLPVQLAAWDLSPARLPPAEAAGCVMLEHAAAEDDVLLLGYARGFERHRLQGEEVLGSLIDAALAMASRRNEDIGWLLYSAPWHSAQVVALGRVLDARWQLDTPPRFAVERVFGRLGPAAALVAANLAVTGLREGRCWSSNGRAAEARPLVARNALVITLAPLGQCAVAVLGGGDA